MKVTEVAKKEILKKGKCLKIIVDAGGCNGFEYEMEFVNDKSGLIEINDLVLTDEYSLNLIQGSTLDFLDEFGKREFTISNPEAKTKCGCGKSFST